MRAPRFPASVSGPFSISAVARRSSLEDIIETFRESLTWPISRLASSRSVSLCDMPPAHHSSLCPGSARHGKLHCQPSTAGSDTSTPRMRLSLSSANRHSAKARIWRICRYMSLIGRSLQSPVTSGLNRMIRWRIALRSCGSWTPTFKTRAGKSRRESGLCARESVTSHGRSMRKCATACHSFGSPPT